MIARAVRLRTRAVSLSLRTTSLALALLCGPSLACSTPSREAAETAPPQAEAEPAPEEPAQVAAAPAEAEPKPQAEPVAAAPAWQPKAGDVTTAEHPIENAEALDYFYDQLAAVDDGEAKVARVVHLGASMIGMDDLPSILRERFQTRFGDGGAGLVLLQRYMSNYIHKWVDLSGKGWKHCYIGYLCRPDGHYGLGGATFNASSGAKTTISTRDAELGGSASHLEIWYAGQKRGGRLKVTVDDEEPRILETRAEGLEDRFETIEVEPGPHKVRVQPGGGGDVRAYGVVLETAGPGVVWDQFSWLGAFTRRMHGWNPEHIAGHIKQRDPALVVFTFGGNDTRRLANKKITAEQYTAEFVKGIELVRAGKPEMSCLVTAMTDRSRSLDFDVTKVLDEIVEAQRQAAIQAGCGFFDSFKAMGGKGSLAAWRKKRPSLAAPDRKHLNHAGREVLGGWMYDALIAGYVAHRTKAAPK